MTASADRAISAARSLWTVVEPYHAIVYFAPEARPTYAAAGLKGGWMGYFASRSAAMGPVPAEVVIATFHNFHPAMVRRAIPDAWTFCTPKRVLAARRAVADAALRRLLGATVESPAVREALALARAATEDLDPAGRALFGGHASLPWPGEPHLALWHGATLLREHRGDGHVAALVAEGIDGCEAHVVKAGTGAVDPATQRAARGWSEEEWEEAADRLRGRGWLDGAGALTQTGRAAQQSLEARTDELAAAPLRRLGPDRAARLVALMAEVIGPIAGGAGGLPSPNPIGLTPPAPA